MSIAPDMTTAPLAEAGSKLDFGKTAVMLKPALARIRILDCSGLIHSRHQ